MFSSKMAPNLLVKAVFVRGDYEAESKVKCRTDFILQNVFSFSIRNGGTFQAMPAVNSKEETVLKELKTIIEDFRYVYISPIQNMISNINSIALDSLPVLMRRVSDELFCEGITWSRMIGFFVFVGELTLSRMAKDSSDDIVDRMYESFCRHVKENLIDWVEEHGGWEGVLTLCSKRNSNPEVDATTSSELSTTKSSDRVWLKNFATGAFRIVGTLFQLASPHVQSYA